MEEVQWQNKKLAAKVDSMKNKLDSMAALLSAIAGKNGIDNEETIDVEISEI